MPRIYKPFVSVVNITDSMNEELVAELFKKKVALQTKGPIYLENGTHAQTQNTMTIVPNEIDEDDDEDHYDSENDSNYALVHGMIMDYYSEAFNDNVEDQESLLAHLMMLNRTVNSTFDSATIDRIYGTLVYAIKVEGTDDIEALSFTMILRAGTQFYAIIYYINDNVVQDQMEGPIMQMRNASQDEFRNLSIWKVLMMISKFLKLTNRNDIGGTMSVDRDEWYSFHDPEENPIVFQYNRLWAKLMNDSIDDTTKLYRVIKPCKLFTIDDLKIRMSKDVLYLNNLGTADVMEDLIESFAEQFGDDENSDVDLESLVEGVEEFSTDGRPMEGILLIRNSVTGFPSETMIQQERQVALKGSLYATIGLMDYHLPDGDPEMLMFKEAHEVYQGVTSIVGNLRARKNDIIHAEEGKDTTIITSFGSIDIAETPLWIVLILIPYINYLMRTVKTYEDFHDFDDEIYFKENPILVFLIEHLERMSNQSVN